MSRHRRDLEAGADDQLADEDLTDKSSRGLVSAVPNTRHLPFCKRFIRSPLMIGLTVLFLAAIIATVVAVVVTRKTHDSPEPPAPFSPPVAPQRVQLPPYIKPLAYRIALVPSFDTFQFSGIVDIDLTTVNETATIEFNSIELNISKIEIANGPAIASHSCDVVKETCTLILQQALTPGTNFALKFEYEGILNDNMHGFYRSKYSNNGTEHWLATTQFEAVDARKAFPCWDEPAYKATFQVTLTVPSTMIALNNMPIETTTPSGATTVYKFQKTPLMSTYLVAFIVGNFEHVEGVTQANVTMRVYTPIGMTSKGQFALELGIKCLDYYSEYFNLPYPLPKMDMIAIPDFSAVAMENWGLITYRENALLSDNSSSIATKYRVADVVAHELAHQWFGNIVTMEWWTDLWLNEGFATFIATQAVDHFFPEWDVWTQFSYADLFTALTADALLSSHPIEVPIYATREIDTIFDTISYSKGASVLRMLQTYVGLADFQTGLQNYLNWHKWGNARTNDLWTALAAASGKPVNSVMEVWTRKIGFPLVTVDSLTTSTNNKCMLTLTQHRFLSPGPPKAEEDTTIWTIDIPFSAPSQPHPNASLHLSDRTQTFELHIADCDTSASPPLVLNRGETSVIRVAYTQSMRDNIVRNLYSLKASDRLGFQSDVFAISRAGAAGVPLSSALNVAANFINETDFSVWSELATNVGQVSAAWQTDTVVSEALQRFNRRLYTPIAQKVGWDQTPSNTDVDRLLRALVLDQLGSAGDQATIDTARARFQQFIADPDSLPRDLRGMVFKLVMRNGNETDYDQMVRLFEAATDSEDKVTLLRSIGLARQDFLITKALQYAISGKVRFQDIPRVIIACASTTRGSDLAFDFVRTNWETFFAKNLQASLLSSCVSAVCSGYSSVQKLEMVSVWLAEIEDDSLARTIETVLETITSTIKWKELYSADVTAWALTVPTSRTRENVE